MIFISPGILAPSCQNQSQSKGLFLIYVYGHVYDVSLCIRCFCVLLQLLPQPRLVLRQLKMISEQHSIRAAELGCRTYTELVILIEHSQLFESLARTLQDVCQNKGSPGAWFSCLILRGASQQILGSKFPSLKVLTELL